MASSGNTEIAVVVGAGGTLGGFIARKLADAGLDVLAVGRSKEPLDKLTSSDKRIRSCIADLAHDDSIETVRRYIAAPVRMVVHGPGVPVAGGIATAPAGPIVEAVNIKAGGMLRLVRAVEERLVKGSRLVAIGGHYGFEPNAYAATAGVANAALANLVKQLSLGYGARGITAHLVAPGPAESERLSKIAETRAKQAGITLEAALDEMRGDSAIHALTTPEQVAWAVALLLAPEADALTGSTLFLDSGRRRGIP